MPWVAILVTVLASTGNNVGKALQKEATRTLPRFSMDPKIVQQYVRSRAWLMGLVSDLAGALLMIVAFSLAPVRLLWPSLAAAVVSGLINSQLRPFRKLRQLRSSPGTYGVQ